MIYSVGWCFATSCDLVRPSNIITTHYNAWNRSQVFIYHKDSQDIGRWPLMAATSCDVARLHTIHPPWSTITKMYPSYDVVNASVTVALTLVEHRIGSTLVIRGNIFAGLKWWSKWLLKSPHSIWTKSQVFPMLERGQCAVFVNIVWWNMFSGVTKCG